MACERARAAPRPAGDPTENARLALAALPSLSHAQAQTYPNKPIRIIVPYAAGRHLRHPRAPDRPEAHRGLGPAGDRGEQARRQRQRRRRLRRQERARRLHAAAHRRGRPRHQPERLSEAALRPVEGLLPGGDGVVFAPRAGGASVGRREGRQGAHRAGQGEPGQAQLRGLGHRRRAAARRHRVRAAHRRATGPTSPTRAAPTR